MKPAIVFLLFYSTVTKITSLPVSTSSPVDDNEFACACNTSTTWVDLMLLFDASTFAGHDSLQQLLAYAQTSLAPLNIQNSNCNEKFHTRIGIILYSSCAKVFSPLGTLDRTEFLSISSLPQHNDTGTDIGSAIDLAHKELNGVGGRQNTRHVIVLLSSGYNNGSYADPAQQMKLFTPWGYFITYELLHGSSKGTPVLQNLDNYLSSDQDPLGTILQQKLCTANCFCASMSSIAFMNDEYVTPSAGCLWFEPYFLDFNSASKRCKHDYGARLVQPKTPAQTAFINDLAWGATSHIGLSWNSIRKAFTWVDGDVLSTFQPWMDGNANHTKGMDCVSFTGAIGNTTPWGHSDCKQPLLYICQKACDSQNFCEY